MIDYIVVLGAPICNKKPGLWLKERLDECVSVYHQILTEQQKQQNIKIILSGRGPYYDESGISESQVMFDYLKHMIPESNLIQELQSNNTIENAIYSYQLLKQLNFDIKKDRLHVITSDFHIKRSTIIFCHIKDITKILSNDDFSIKFWPAKTNINTKQYDSLVRRETQIISNLLFF